VKDLLNPPDPSLVVTFHRMGNNTVCIIGTHRSDDEPGAVSRIVVQVYFSRTNPADVIIERTLYMHDIEGELDKLQRAIEVARFVAAQSNDWAREQLPESLRAYNS
jgi:hypothetical protein